MFFQVRRFEEHFNYTANTLSFYKNMNKKYLTGNYSTRRCFKWTVNQMKVLSVLLKNVNIIANQRITVHLTVSQLVLTNQIQQWANVQIASLLNCHKKLGRAEKLPSFNARKFNMENKFKYTLDNKRYHTWNYFLNQKLINQFLNHNSEYLK